MKKLYSILFVSIFLFSCEKEIINPVVPIINSEVKKDTISIFKGYTVAPNAKQLGTRYWENTKVMIDLMIGVYQKNYEVFALPQGAAYCVWDWATTTGDFNNDGYIDIFNAGTAFGGKKANLSFLIWNPSDSTFVEKNLINDKTNFIGAPSKVSPVYLNSDNYVDLIIHGHRDESSPNNPNEPVTLCLSDGKGGYDLVKLELESPELLKTFAHESGDVADLNNDTYPDLFITANNHSYIFWGIPTYPYFTNKNYVDMKTDMAFVPKLVDVNKDGNVDIIISTNVESKILFNNGKGEFTNKIININYPTSETNTMDITDYILDDLNGDGLNDMIILNTTKGMNWTLLVYLQLKDGSFVNDNSWIEYTINKEVRGNGKSKLTYLDFDGDGKKDISYNDGSLHPYTEFENDIKKKTVFVRSGNKFVEKDYYQFDGYAKQIKDKYYK